MSIYIGNDLEDRLEALEAENASLRKYNEYHQVVHEIDHTSDLHVDNSFYKQSMKLDNYSLSPGVWQSFVTIRSCNHLMRIISTYVDNTKKSEIS